MRRPGAHRRIPQPDSHRIVHYVQKRNAEMDIITVPEKTVEVSKHFLQSAPKSLWNSGMAKNYVFRYTYSQGEAMPGIVKAKEKKPCNNVNVKGVLYYGKFIFEECLQGVS